MLSLPEAGAGGVTTTMSLSIAFFGRLVEGALLVGAGCVGDVLAGSASGVAPAVAGLSVEVFVVDGLLGVGCS
jgi:hypothetical protein